MKRFLMSIIILIAFCAIMIFGIMYGHQHPQIFFWGIMGIFAVLVDCVIAPTLKDAIILAVGMGILALAGTCIDKIVYHFLGDNIISLIVSGVLLFPFYWKLLNHFLDMCKKMVRRMKQEESEK